MKDCLGQNTAHTQAFVNQQISTIMEASCKVDAFFHNFISGFSFYYDQTLNGGPILPSKNVFLTFSSYIYSSEDFSALLIAEIFYPPNL